MKKNKILILFVFIFFIATARPLFAAQIFLDSTDQRQQVGKDFIVSVFLSTEGQSINAVEGNIVFPSSLSVKEIKLGNSFINFWIDSPHVLPAGGKILFSGITSGGLNGDRLFLFSLLMKGQDTGDVALEVRETKTLLNDGAGTETPSKQSRLLLTFEESDGLEKEGIVASVDDTPPESFLPLIAKDNSLFEGRYFVVFNTNDKDSGIDHYEVREGLFGEWKIAESPYPLSDQGLERKVYVKAVDISGNKRIQAIKAGNSKWDNSKKVLAILILGPIILGIFLLRKKWVNSLPKQ